jgi:hypothetical protein
MEDNADIPTQNIESYSGLQEINNYNEVKSM